MKRLGLLGLAMMSACQGIVGLDAPLEYSHGERFDNSILREAVLRPLWNELEKCSGLNRNLSDLQFYSVSRATLGPPGGSIRIFGLYFPRTNRIFVVESRMWDRAVIRHEMMHALLREEEGHPPRYFGADGLCGSV